MIIFFFLVKVGLQECLYLRVNEVASAKTTRQLHHRVRAKLLLQWALIWFLLQLALMKKKQTHNLMFRQKTKFKYDRQTTSLAIKIFEWCWCNCSLFSLKLLSLICLILFMLYTKKHWHKRQAIISGQGWILLSFYSTRCTPSKFFCSVILYR